MSWLKRAFTLPRRYNSLSDLFRESGRYEMFQAWLASRALVLPAEKRAELAARLGVAPRIVMEVEHEIQASALAELAKHKGA